MSLDKIKSDRIKKLENIRAEGVDPYPAKTWQREKIGAVLEKFGDLVQAKKEVVLAGRLRSLRGHGGSAFADLEDDSGKIQLYFKKDAIGEKDYKFFIDNIDVGDFIQAKGTLFSTQKNERTLLVEKFEILTKSLNQLPEKWHGLKDVEERFRKRYLDILMNKEVGGRFLKRSQVISKLRDFFEAHGFLEVETPILQPLPGGAMAQPFRTHLNALDIDLYLRVAPELYLKRLLVGGFEKVYEIGKSFRNEGMDKVHNPDFTMLECYWAYADYEDLIMLTEELFSFLAGRKEIDFLGQKINLSRPFERIAMRDVIAKHYKIDINKAKRSDLEKKLKELGQETNQELADCKLIDEIFKTIRSKILQPTVIFGHPILMSPLAKTLKNNPKEAARFQLIVGGMEIINAYSELNDPQEQAKRMEEQEKFRHDNDIQRFDEDYIEALEYGMPPAAGLGLGVDRLVQLLTNTANIREVILFPTMRQKE